MFWWLTRMPSASQWAMMLRSGKNVTCGMSACLNATDRRVKGCGCLVQFRQGFEHGPVQQLIHLML